MSSISQSSRRALVSAKFATIHRLGEDFAVRVRDALGRVAVLHGEDGYPVRYRSPEEAERDVMQFRVTNGLPIETDISPCGIYLP